MFLKRTVSSDTRYQALFDIGATSIGACIARKGATGCDMLWQTRIDYAYGVYDDYVRYERAMYSTLLDVSMTLMNDGVKTAKEVDSSFAPKKMDLHCILASPWFFGGVQKVSHTTESPFELKEDLFKTLLQRGSDTLAERADCVSWREVVGKSVVLSHVAQAVQLEGYEVRSYAHKQVHEATIIGYFALVGETVLTQVHDILERVLPTRPLHITTSTELLARLRSHCTNKKNTIDTTLVEVGGQVTNIASIRKGVLAQVRTIPIGTNEFLKAVAPAAATVSEARGKLRVLFKNAEGGQGDVYPTSLQDVLSAWIASVREELCNQSNGVTPSKEVVVMASERWYPLILPALAEPWKVPGIRRKIAMNVVPFETLLENTASKEKTASTKDNRLCVFTGALQ